jgi:hypothetical protein
MIICEGAWNAGPSGLSFFQLGVLRFDEETETFVMHQERDQRDYRWDEVDWARRTPADDQMRQAHGHLFTAEGTPAEVIIGYLTAPFTGIKGADFFAIVPAGNYPVDVWETFLTARGIAWR